MPYLNPLFCCYSFPHTLFFNIYISSFIPLSAAIYSGQHCSQISISQLRCFRVLWPPPTTKTLITCRRSLQDCLFPDHREMQFKIRLAQGLYTAVPLQNSFLMLCNFLIFTSSCWDQLPPFPTSPLYRQVGAWTRGHLPGLVSTATSLLPQSPKLIRMHYEVLIFVSTVQTLSELSLNKARKPGGLHNTSGMLDRLKAAQESQVVANCSYYCRCRSRDFAIRNGTNKSNY